jgi:methionyl-tRNA formyltransferase
VIFINAHAGRLPKYGGMNVVEWAVYNDDPVYGTVHRIERGIDTGDILQETLLPLGHPSTVADLRAVAFAAVWAMVPEALTKLANGEISFRKQPRDLPRIQWYRMHQELLKVVQAKLDDKSFFAIQEWHLAQAGRRVPVDEIPMPLQLSL